MGRVFEPEPLQIWEVYVFVSVSLWGAWADCSEIHKFMFRPCGFRSVGHDPTAVRVTVVEPIAASASTFVFGKAGHELVRRVLN